MPEELPIPWSEAEVRRRARALAERGDYAALAALLSDSLPDLRHPLGVCIELLEAYRRAGLAGELEQAAWQLIRRNVEPERIAREAVLRMSPAAPGALALARVASILVPDDAAAVAGLVRCRDQRGEFAAALRGVRRHEILSGRIGQLASQQAEGAWSARRWAAAGVWFGRLIQLAPSQLRLRSYLHTMNEMQAREHAFPGACPIAGMADRLLPAGERTSILFVGARGEDIDARFRGIPANRLEVVGVDPELDQASDPASTGIALRYLPDALSDREDDMVFYETDSSGGSSLFKPSAAAGRYMSPSGRSWGEQLQVTARRQIRTTSVDAIAKRGDLGRIDALYVNIQGGELAVLRGARRSLAHTFAVQVEVAFVPHYEGAPDWRAVDAELIEQGFVLTDIRSLMTAGRTRVGLRARLDNRLGYDRWPSRQLAEAHLLYLRDPVNPAHRRSGLFRTTRDWLVFALWAEYHGQIEIALEALMALVDDPAVVEDPQSVERLASEVGAVIERYRSFVGNHYG